MDWEKTDTYAESVRAARYAGTRGPDDFALLSGAVTTALTDIAVTQDPNRKIAMAAEARVRIGDQLAVVGAAFRVEEVLDLGEPVAACNLQDSGAARIARNNPRGRHAALNAAEGTWF